jgi:hypothetical protein
MAPEAPLIPTMIFIIMSSFSFNPYPKQVVYYRAGFMLKISV